MEIGFGLLSAEASKCSYRAQVHLGDLRCSFPFRLCYKGASPVRDFGFRIQLKVQWLFMYSTEYSSYTCFCRETLNINITGHPFGELERVCSQTQLCQLRYFNDYTRQLHVSAPTGHLQVVLKRT